MITQAVLFDFNGTLSNDESLLFDLFREVFLEKLDFDMSETYYYAHLAGLSDIEIVRHVTDLSQGLPKGTERMILAEKVRRYQEAIVKCPRIDKRAVELVLRLAEQVPVGVVTGAIHEEVDMALRSVGLYDIMQFVIAGEDVTNGKPDPEGYLKALAHLDGTIQPEHIVVFEDSMAGFSAARSAGMTPVAVVGTTPLERIPSYVNQKVNDLSIESCKWIFDTLVSNVSFRLQR